jgi:hypothetical protein
MAEALLTKLRSSTFLGFTERVSALEVHLGAEICLEERCETLLLRVAAVPSGVNQGKANPQAEPLIPHIYLELALPRGVSEPALAAVIAGVVAAAEGTQTGNA